MFVLAIAGAGAFSLDRLVVLYLQQRQRDKEMVVALLAAERDMRVTLRV